VTGDGLVAALLLCRSLAGRTLAEAAAEMPRYPQIKENVRVRSKILSESLVQAVAAANEELSGRGRVLVRPSGTEPVIRVLAEARDEEEAAHVCASIAALVRRELG
jgi:phosphoglucosamine mutase